MNAIHQRPKRWATAAVALAGVFLAAPACNNGRTPEPADTDAAPKAPLFLDLTDSSGIKHTYNNGEAAEHFAIIESLGPGMALIDYDGDGLLDVFVTGGGYFDKTHKEFMKDRSKPPGLHGYPWKLYKNLGNFHFKDVTREVGLDKLAGDKEFFYSQGAAVCDFDRDGWPDLLITGWHRMALFRNVPDGKGGRRFVDVSQQVGLPEGLWSTSAAWADLDGDGWPDLYVCQYVDWSFKNEKTHPVHCTYDGKTRDVCPPKLFTALPHHVFHNVPADPKDPSKGRRFVDVSNEAGLRMPRTPEEYKALALTIRQYYIREKKGYAKLSDKEREHCDNEIDKKVERWLERLRKAQDEKEYGKGMCALAIDVNGDGKPDLYVANDTVDNFLYMNRSKPGQILLEEVGMPSGTARDDRGMPNGSMGLAAFDYERCGRPSVWVTNFENELHCLYHNECMKGVKGQEDKEYFNFATQLTGIAAIGQFFVGWGTGTLDLYHDGWESIFVSNGHAIRFPKGRATRRQRPVLLQNLGMDLETLRKHQERLRQEEREPQSKREGWSVRFKDISDLGGPYFNALHQGRGVALGDLDNDGRIDIVVIHLNEPVAVLKNDADTRGNHWLGVELIGKDHADVVGAKITLEVDGAAQYRFAQGGGSFASSGDRRHVFGLGKATKVGRLTVTWPSGDKQSWDGLAIDRYWRLVQGTKEAQAPPKAP
jgi:hypothetical protein